MAIIRGRSVVILLFGLCMATVGGADGITYSRVIGPEFPGAYKHPAAIEELDNGDLYIVYYGGDGEYAEDTAVYGLRRKRGENAWSTPTIVADTNQQPMAIWCARNREMGDARGLAVSTRASQIRMLLLTFRS